MDFGEWGVDCRNSILLAQSAPNKYKIIKCCKIHYKKIVPYLTHSLWTFGEGQRFYLICGFTCRAGVHLPPYCLNISVCDGGSKPPPYDFKVTPPSALPDSLLRWWMIWHFVSWIDATHHDLLAELLCNSSLTWIELPKTLMHRSADHVRRTIHELQLVHADFGNSLRATSLAFSIFSIKIPYPVVGSLISTWVTAPTSLPFWMMGEPDTSVFK